MPPSEPLRVFISYARKDGAALRRPPSLPPPRRTESEGLSSVEPRSLFGSWTRSWELSCCLTRSARSRGGEARCFRCLPIGHRASTSYAGWLPTTSATDGPLPVCGNPRRIDFKRGDHFQQADFPGVISHKPVSREFAREWQFNGLPTSRSCGLFLSGRRSGPQDSREGSNQSSAQSIRRTSAITKNAGTDAAATSNTGAG